MEQISNRQRKCNLNPAKDLKVPRWRCVLSSKFIIWSQQQRNKTMNRFMYHYIYILYFILFSSSNRKDVSFAILYGWFIKQNKCCRSCYVLLLKLYISILKAKKICIYISYQLFTPKRHMELKYFPHRRQRRLVHIEWNLIAWQRMASANIKLTHRKISKLRRTKFQNLNVSHLVL